MCNNHFTL